MKNTAATPVRYTPSVEQMMVDEDLIVLGIREQMRRIMDVTSKDYGHAVRSVHAKGHALVDGHFTVLADLPADLAQGLFSTPGNYTAIARISTNPGDLLDDAISVPRGFALKIVGVEGERLAGSEGDVTQDFVMVNGPAFVAPNTKAFLGNLKLLVPTTDRAESLKKAASAVFQLAESAIERVGLQSALLTSLGGAPNTNPLGDTYYSQTPFRYGKYIAKFALVPVSDNLTRLTKQKIHVNGRSDALREDLSNAFAAGPSTWELRVQLCVDWEKMPIEDASIAWNEELSPYRTVARLDVPAQPGWTMPGARTREDGLAFSPWHGLAAHRPLGGINRARRESYNESARSRAAFNHCPLHEPRL